MFLALIKGSLFLFTFIIHCYRLTYAIHGAQPGEGASCHFPDAVFMDPQLNQRGGQVLWDARQVIFGEIQFLHVLKGQECSGVDFGDVVIP